MLYAFNVFCMFRKVNVGWLSSDLLCHGYKNTHRTPRPSPVSLPACQILMLSFSQMRSLMRFVWAGVNTVIELRCRPKNGWDLFEHVVRCGYNTQFVCSMNMIRPLSVPISDRTGHFWTKPALIISYAVHYGLRTWIRGWPRAVMKYVAFLILWKTTVQPSSVHKV